MGRLEIQVEPNRLFFVITQQSTNHPSQTFSMSGLRPWIALFWFPLESWFNWLLFHRFFITWHHCAPPVLFFQLNDLRVSWWKALTLSLVDKGEDHLLICNSSKTTKWYFMNLSLILNYMTPSCTSCFAFPFYWLTSLMGFLIWFLRGYHLVSFAQFFYM